MKVTFLKLFKWGIAKYSICQKLEVLKEKLRALNTLAIHKSVTIYLFVGIWEDCESDSLGLRISVYDALDINSCVSNLDFLF